MFYNVGLRCQSPQSLLSSSLTLQKNKLCRLPPKNIFSLNLILYNFFDIIYIKDKRKHSQHSKDLHSYWHKLRQIAFIGFLPCFKGTFQAPYKSNALPPPPFLDLKHAVVNFHYILMVPLHEPFLKFCKIKLCKSTWRN